MFNTANIPQLVLDETFRGLESETTSLADELASRIEVADIAGVLPTAPSINSLAQLRGGIAEGAQPPVEIMDFSSTTYSTLRFVGVGGVADGVRMSLEAMNYSALEVIARRCRQQAGAGIDAALNTVLTSAALNTAVAVGGGVWTNPASTPLDDIQTAVRTCGFGDTICLGNDVGFALQEHPDFTARFSNYSGGAISEGELGMALRGIWPNFTNIVIGGRLYNSANPAAAVTLAYQFDGTAWVGHKSDLVMAEMGSGTSESQRDMRSEIEEIRFTRRVDIVRPHQEMAVVLTGVI